MLANATAEEISAQFGDKSKKAFVVDAKEIVSNKFDFSINRYKEVVYETVEYADPKVILAELKQLENEILQGMNELEELLK